MMDLDNKIHNWCRSIHTFGRNRTARVEELKDHLYCVIEHLCEEGLTEKQAFMTATEQMGSIAALKDEHTKNKNLISLYFSFLFQRKEKIEEWQQTIDPKKVIGLNLIIALTFVVVALFADFVTEGSQYNQLAKYSLFTLWIMLCIPLTMLSYGLVGLVEAFKLECLIIKRAFASLVNRG